MGFKPFYKDLDISILPLATQTLADFIFALQRRHVSAMISQIKTNSTIYFPFILALVYSNNKENIKTLRNWHFAGVDSPHKGTTMRYVCPCHDVIFLLITDTNTKTRN